MKASEGQVGIPQGLRSVGCGTDGADDLDFDGGPDVQALSLGPQSEPRGNLSSPQRGGANVSSQDVASMVIDTGHDRTRGWPWLA